MISEKISSMSDPVLSMRALINEVGSERKEAVKKEHHKK